MSDNELKTGILPFSFCDGDREGKENKRQRGRDRKGGENEREQRREIWRDKFIVFVCIQIMNIKDNIDCKYIFSFPQCTSVKVKH